MTRPGGGTGWALFASVLALTALPLRVAAQEPPVSVDPLPVVERTLANGMRVQVLERRGSPTVAFVVQYRVGGVNEKPGETGIAHLLEHMLFKGSTTVGTRNLAAELALFDTIDAVHDSILTVRDSRRVPAAVKHRLANHLRRLEDRARQHVEPNQFSRILTRHGARGLNATTSSESTHYFVELPSNRVKLWMMLEADRMLNPVFREFYRERDVVLEERRTRVESNPDGLMSEAFLAAAFTEHPYGQPVVGRREDVAYLGRPEVEAYYKTYYGARNAVVTIVGDVDADQVVRWAGEYLERIPPGEEPPPVTAVEPPQTTERRIEVPFDAEPRIRIGWHVPAATHDDAPALFMTTTLLSGGRTSRLYRRMVLQDRLVSSVTAGIGPGGRYPTLLSISAFPRAPHTVQEAELAIYDEVERLKKNPPSPVELERVRNQLEAGRVRRLVSNLGLAFQLSEATAEYGDWRQSFRVLERIQAVRPEDVQRVVRTYMVDSNRTVATVVPIPPAVVASTSDAPPEAGVVSAGPAPDPAPSPAPPVSAPDRSVPDSTGLELSAVLDPGAPAIGLEPALSYRSPPLRFRATPVRKHSVAGVTVVHAEDDALPLVNILLRIQGGYGLYGREAYGVLNALPALLRNGGTADLPPDSVDALMEYYAIQSSFGGGGEAIVTSANVLDRHLDLALHLWKDLLLRPRFDSTQVEVWRGQELESVRRRFDSPVRIAYSRFNHLMYGDHPIGWELSPADLEPEDVTGELLRAFHSKIVCRENIIMGVAGNVGWDDLEPRLEAFLDGWPTCESEPPKGPTPITRPGGGVFLLPNNSEQAVIVMGQPSNVRQDASVSFVASRIANAILGASGFSSRLFQQVRTEAGYAYSAASVWTTRPEADGLLGAVTQTSPETAVPAVQLILEIMEEFEREGPTVEEVRDAVDETVNSYVFGFQSAGQMVSRRMALEGRSLPDNWPERYVEMVQALTRRDIRRVFRTTFEPTEMTVLIVGDPERIGPALETLGPYVTLPETIPVPTDVPVPTDPSQGSLEKGSAPHGAQPRLP